jgi:hypothetical protein
MPADPLPTVNGRPGNREVPGVWRRGRPRPSLEASDTQAGIRGPRQTAEREDVDGGPAGCTDARREAE